MRFLRGRPADSATVMQDQARMHDTSHVASETRGTVAAAAKGSRASRNGGLEAV